MEISHNAEIGKFHNGSGLVIIDGNQGFCVPHAKGVSTGAGNTAGYHQIGGNGFTGLSDLTLLADPLVVHRHPGAGNRGPQCIRQIVDKREAVFVFHAFAAADD